MTCDNESCQKDFGAQTRQGDFCSSGGGGEENTSHWVLTLVSVVFDNDEADEAGDAVKAGLWSGGGGRSQKQQHEWTAGRGQIIKKTAARRRLTVKVCLCCWTDVPGWCERLISQITAGNYKWAWGRGVTARMKIRIKNASYTLIKLFGAC